MQDEVSWMAEMIRRARSGDREALGQLLDRYRGYLRVLAERQIGGPLGRRLDASDVVQQTFLEAHRDFVAFQGASEPELAAWLERVLQHNVAQVIRDHANVAKRAVGREQPLERPSDTSTGCGQPLAGEQSSPSQRAMRGESAVRLAHALDSLPPDQREAVRLRHLEGWTLEQIAQHLDLNDAPRINE